MHQKKEKPVKIVLSLSTAGRRSSLHLSLTIGLVKYLPLRTLLEQMKIVVQGVHSRILPVEIRADILEGRGLIRKMSHVHTLTSADRIKVKPLELKESGLVGPFFLALSKISSQRSSSALAKTRSKR